MSEQPKRYSGGCLCGGVRYVVRGPLGGVVACHCSQCRRTSGHYAAMTSAPSSKLELITSASLAWFKSSTTAERGFCNCCGSNLFWRRFDGDVTSITAGSLDTPTEVSMERHIFVADKADYYSLEDDLPKTLRW